VVVGGEGGVSREKKKEKASGHYGELQRAGMVRKREKPGGGAGGGKNKKEGVRYVRRGAHGVRGGDQVKHSHPPLLHLPQKKKKTTKGGGCPENHPP